MKKSTKVLLVLAAIVAMTIGAVSTVMADDSPVIATWGGSEKDGYTAKTAEGTDIESGWAVTTGGIWYYFREGKMLANEFITDRGNMYFLGASGAMHTGWAAFTKDSKVSNNGAPATTIKEALGQDSMNGIEDYLNTAPYKTVYIYCNADGTVVRQSWVKDHNLWYFMEGYFCVMDDYNYTVPDLNGNGKVDADEGVFGFSGNGNMHVGWIKLEKTDKKDAVGANTPYEKPGTSEVKTTGYIYYNASGKKATEGWSKIGDTWYYFSEDEAITGATGAKNPGAVMLSNTYLEEITADKTYHFFLNASGAMAKGEVTLGTTTNTNAVYGTYVVDRVNEVAGVGEDNITLTKADGLVTLLFGSTDGIQLFGLQNGYYYLKNNDKVYSVATADKTANGVTAKAVDVIMDGAKIKGTFFVADGGDLSKISYYTSSRIVKSQAVTMANTIFILDKDGKLVQPANEDDAAGKTKHTMNGVDYYFNDGKPLAFEEDLVVPGLSKTKAK